MTGRIVNTGRQALTYTSIACVFADATGTKAGTIAGTEAGRGDGYLLAGPGQSAKFRALLPLLPASAKLSLRLKEAGQPVIVEMPAIPRLLTQIREHRLIF